MKYSGIIYNDFAAAKGVSLTFFAQGCPHHCEGCHNPETWDFNGGIEFTEETLNTIIKNINKNNILRNLCIMGGEPLCEQNLDLVLYIILNIKKCYPNIKVYIWTGYTYEELIEKNNDKINNILDLIDVLVDGRFILSLRDITLFMRGSSNQRIIDIKKTKEQNKIILWEE